MNIANMFVIFYKNYIRIGEKSEIEIRIKERNLILWFELTDLRVRVKKRDNPFRVIPKII